MARTGRKPLPVEIHEMRGSYKKNPQRRKQTPRAKGRPQKPRHLDEYGRKEWDRICKLLKSMGVLSATDAPAIEQYCESYSEWRRAKEKVEKIGLAIVSKDKKGNIVVRRNPFLSVKQQAAHLCHRYLSEFGLTPSARSSLDISGNDEPDAMTEFLQKRMMGRG